MKPILPILLSAIAASAGIASAFGQQVVWPGEMKAIEYLSAADNTKQPSLFYAPKSDTPIPLVVVLHSWGGDWKQLREPAYGAGVALWLSNHKWALIHPHFRGNNTTKESLGSDLAVADIVSAVDYAKRNANIDEKRIYLVGQSGGGHIALVMAGRHPEIWAGVSAWVPPVDLVAFYRESEAGAKKSPYKTEFLRNLNAACGGPPGTSHDVDQQYQRRSPLMWLPNAKNLPLDINAGITDGYGAAAVSIRHSLKAFNAVADPADRITDAEMNAFTMTDVPKGLEFTGVDPLYGPCLPLFRRESGKTRVTIFRGGHQAIWDAAFNWLSQQKKE